MTKSGGFCDPMKSCAATLATRTGRGKNGGCCHTETLQYGSNADLIDLATTPIPPYAVPKPEVTSATLFCKEQASLTKKEFLYSIICTNICTNRMKLLM